MSRLVATLRLLFSSCLSWFEYRFETSLLRPVRSLAVPGPALTVCIPDPQRISQCVRSQTFHNRRTLPSFTSQPSIFARCGDAEFLTSPDLAIHTQIDICTVPSQEEKKQKLRRKIDRSDNGPAWPIMSRYKDAVVQVQSRLDRIIRKYALIITPEEYRREVTLRVKSLHVDKRNRAIWLAEFAKLQDAAGDSEKATKIWENSQFRSLHYRLQKPSQGTISGKERDFRSPWLLWPSTAFYLLSNSPLQAIEFLEASNRKPFPPLYLVSRCFLYLRSFCWDEIASSQELEYKFRRLLLDCLCPRRWVVNTPGLAIRLYCQFASYEDRQKAFATITQYGIRAGLEELLYLMSLFTKDAKVDDALNVLQYISQQFRSQLSSDIVRQHCCDLLLLDELQIRDDGDFAFHIWPSILNMHVQPDLAMLNIILRLAIQHGMTKTAWDILDLVDAKGFDPDSYTWLSLIEHTMHRRSPEELDRLDSQINPGISTEPHIVSKSLHAHLKVSLPFSSTSPYEKLMIYSRMVEILATAHDPRSLVDLGILRSAPLLSAGATTTKSPPSPHSLHCILSAFLKIQTKTDVVMQIFRRFRQHVCHGHPHIGVLGETDYVYNAFLLALQATDEPINASLEILLAMLEPLPETARLPSDNGFRSIQPIRPTSITWTIVLTTFMPLRYRHPEAVSKIGQLMSEQGFGLDRVSEAPTVESTVS